MVLTQNGSVLRSRRLRAGGGEWEGSERQRRGSSTQRKERAATHFVMMLQGEEWSQDLASGEEEEDERERERRTHKDPLGVLATSSSASTISLATTLDAVGAQLSSMCCTTSEPPSSLTIDAHCPVPRLARRSKKAGELGVVRMRLMTCTLDLVVRT